MWTAELEVLRQKYRTIGLEYECECRIGRTNYQLPKGLFCRLGEEGLFHIQLEDNKPEHVAKLAAALEGLCYGVFDGGTGISLASHIGLCLNVFYRYATNELKQKYDDVLRSGLALMSFATTESHGGSDPQRLTSQLIPLNNGYLLTGEKWCITNAPIATLIITTARETKNNIPVSVVVEPDWPGVDRSKVLKPIGLQSSPIGKVEFKDVFIPKSHILGKPGEGLNILNEAFFIERLLAPFMFAGAMERVLSMCMEYAQQRKVANVTIGDHQYIRKRITDIKINLELTKAIGHQALTKYIGGENASSDVSIGKSYGANALSEAAINAIKIFGSYGIVENPISELLASSVAACIAGGTEEMHREVIYLELYREYRKCRTHTSST